MIRYSVLLAIVFFFNSLALANMPKPIAEKDIDTFGVYVKSSEGYVSLQPYEYAGNYAERKHYNEIPIANRDGEVLELLVYQEEFDIKSVVFELRDIDMLGSSKQIQFSVSPLSQENKYLLKTTKPVANGVLLQVFQYQWFQRDFAVVALGNPAEKMLQVLGDTNEPAYAVLPAIKNLSQAYPKNKGFKKLLPLWEKKYKQEKDQKDYGYVQENWDKFNQYKKLATKSRFLKEVVREASNYLNQHPKGIYAAEAKERKSFAETKLKEYKELL